MSQTALASCNVRRISHLDLPGGGQVIVDGDYAYAGHMTPPYGTSITDVADPKNPRIVSTIEVEGDASHSHKVRVKLDDSFVYVTWFSGGLRIVDIKDPEVPEEVGYFIPEPVSGEASPQSNDVEVDGRGLIYLLDRNVGLDILEFDR